MNSMSFLQGFANVGKWGTRVKDMWNDGILSPIPIKQELEPIYKILLTDAVKNIVHDDGKEIEMIHRLFLVIAMYCQGSSSQIKSITQPLLLLAGWEGSLGTCSR